VLWLVSATFARLQCTRRGLLEPADLKGASRLKKRRELGKSLGKD
jgi:hypothetical protein